MSLATAFFFLYRLGRGSLASWDEAIYAGVAKDIVTSGNWLRLTLGGEPWFDKPPLCIWTTAVFYKIFGVGEFTARLFSALCGLGTVLLTYALGSKLLGRWAGFLGALVLATSSHFVRFSRFGMMDAPFTFFFTLAAYFFWLGREREKYFIYSGIAVGLAAVAKSLAGLVLVPMFWLYAVLAGEGEIFKRRAWWAGVAAAVLVALPWNLYQWIFYREAYLRDVILRHFFQRTSTAIEGHTGNVLYYLRVLVNKYHPWIFVALVSSPAFLFKAFRERKKEIIFLTVWMFFYFGLITAVKTKLAWYILPLYPPLSLSVGYFLARIFKEDQKKPVAAIFLAVMLAHGYYSHLLNADYSRDVKGIAPLIEEKVPKGARIYLYNYHESPAAIFYLGRKILYLDDGVSLARQSDRDREIYLLIHAKDADALRPALQKGLFADEGGFENLRLFHRS